MGIELEAATAEEIFAAIQDMIAWVKDPALPETIEQLNFRVAVERASAEIKTARDLTLPIADYLGYVLPGYRTSPSVARLRHELTTSASHSEELAKQQLRSEAL